MVFCQLTGEDGNAFAVMARVKRALRDAKVSREDQEAYFKAATAGDYDHLLNVSVETLEKFDIEYE
jgi:hypothetical protein